MTDRLRSTVERTDPDELLRLIDGLTSAEDWDEVYRLGVLCRDAVERGKQLWGVAEHVDYRLALEAPGRWAGWAAGGSREIHAGPASRGGGIHPRLGRAGTTPRSRTSPTMTAHERVVRGDDLAEEPMVDQAVLEIPMRLESWEPDYQVATFRSDRLDFPSPPLPEMERFESGDAPRVADVAVAEAMLGLGSVPWQLMSRTVVPRPSPSKVVPRMQSVRSGLGGAGSPGSTHPKVCDGWLGRRPMAERMAGGGDRRRQVRGLADGGSIGRRRMAAGTRPNGGSDRAIGVVPVGRSGARYRLVSPDRGRRRCSSPGLGALRPGRGMSHGVRR